VTVAKLDPAPPDSWATNRPYLARNLSLHRQNVPTINHYELALTSFGICLRARGEVANWRWAGGVFSSKPRELTTPDYWQRISRIFSASSAAVYGFFNHAAAPSPWRATAGSA
jgi:hypothetical protein